MLIVEINKPTKEEFLMWFEILDGIEVDDDYEELSYYQKNKGKWVIYKQRRELGIQRDTRGRYKMDESEKLPPEEIKRRKLEYLNDYREKNKEALLKYQREYHEKNKEERNEKNKKYRQKNPEKIKDYYKKNKEKILKYQKEYYEKNKSIMNEKHKQYYIKKRDENV